MKLAKAGRELISWNSYINKQVYELVKKCDTSIINWPNHRRKRIKKRARLGATSLHWLDE
jgi:hypothetical protein